jgi:hypothetical protein
MTLRLAGELWYKTENWTRLPNSVILDKSASRISVNVGSAYLTYYSKFRYLTCPTILGSYMYEPQKKKCIFAHTCGRLYYKYKSILLEVPSFKAAVNRVKGSNGGKVAIYL